ncbi:MAG: ATP-binding cassette domain-containing protein [Spirochaetaceae bacterium]|jgi:D-methionine transport system ATP-binding protein|nr:ATP-binding cassette domain-containing protein [Spirochaetaceae bacterium]
MISLKGVTKSYGGFKAVDAVDLEVSDGSVFGIIGKSGAGKSTLLRLMSLLERPDSGEIHYGSERLDTLNERDLLFWRRKMGTIFQNFNLLSSRNVRDNVAYPLEIAGWSKHDITARVAALLELVGIADKSAERLRTLSGGQKQRVAIARALAAHPKVLFCDEATSALDPQTTHSILKLIQELHERLRITVIVVTHQMDVLRTLCHEVAVISGGRIVEQGGVKTLFSSSASIVVKELLALHEARDE